MVLPLRTDFDAAALRAAARRSKNAARTRRLLALAAVYDGVTRTEVARIGGVTLQIIRDWVVKFNATGPDGLVDRKAPGQPSRLGGALAAGALVAALAVVMHRPLARVPENTLKFAVGVLISVFGVFWTGERLGIAWPGHDLSLLVLIGLIVAAGLAGVRVARSVAAWIGAR
jgi:hypothetical protein